jgi:O-methyltransferase
MKSTIRHFIQAAGYSVTRADDHSRLADISPEIISTIEKVKPYSMTSSERLAALCEGVEYVCKNNVAGDFVECGVWKGGSCMAAALTFARLGRDVPIWLYDTFEGMSEPTDLDRDSRTGASAAQLLARSKKFDTASSVRAYSPLEQVQKNLATTGYQRIKFIKGKVEDTIPSNIPDKICILRLDTDWYESTKHELQHLYPRLVSGGVLILDDYGHWAGARRAVDEYFAVQGLPMLLNRIDYSGRIGVKI